MTAYSGFGTWRALAVGGAFAGVALSAGAAGAQTHVPLAAHRAIYDLSLQSAKGDSGPARARVHEAQRPLEGLSSAPIDWQPDTQWPSR